MKGANRADAPQRPQAAQHDSRISAPAINDGAIGNEPRLRPDRFTAAFKRSLVKARFSRKTGVGVSLLLAVAAYAATHSESSSLLRPLRMNAAETSFGIQAEPAAILELLTAVMNMAGSLIKPNAANSSTVI